MDGEVPEIYWFWLWVGVLIFVIAFATAMTILISRSNAKALALLTLYAQKGIDPPPTLAELRAKPTPEGSGRCKTAASRGALSTGEERRQ